MQTLLKKLISFQSDEYHPEEIERIFSFAVSWLKDKGLKVKTYSSNSKLSLVAAKKIKKKYRFILNGHLDVVPASYKNAFSPYIENNRLYGRGASDMKGPVAALMKLIADKEVQKTDTALMLTTDEEVGGFDGVAFLVNEKGYHANCVVIPDGGDNWQLVLGEKGVLHIKIESKGRSAHSSCPWLGENAIEKLIYIFEEIKKEMPPLKPKKYWHPTVNLGKIEGGEATNQVPAFASMNLDFRYPQKEDRKKLLQIVSQAVEKQKGTKFKILAEGEPLVNNPKNKYLVALKKLAEEERISFSNIHGHAASDGRFFSAKGIPVVMFKPRCSQPHIDNEWIDINDLNRFFVFLKKYLLRYGVR